MDALSIHPLAGVPVNHTELENGQADAAEDSRSNLVNTWTGLLPSHSQIAPWSQSSVCMPIVCLRRNCLPHVCLKSPDSACLRARSFHGKDPSKNKKDKRFRKIAEEQERKRRTMSAIGEDHALSRLAAVQEQSATPYLVRLLSKYQSHMQCRLSRHPFSTTVDRTVGISSARHGSAQGSVLMAGK